MLFGSSPVTALKSDFARVSSPFRAQSPGFVHSVAEQIGCQNSKIVTFHRDEDAGDLPIQAIDAVLASTSTALLPVDLARLAMVANSLRTAVAVICAHLLQHTCLLLRPPGRIPTRADAMALHRVRRFESLHSKCSASDNYSVAIVDGAPMVCGRPEWFPSTDVKSKLPREWQSLRAMPSGKYSKQEAPVVVSLTASRHAVFALTSEGQVLYISLQRNSNNDLVSINLLPLDDLAGVKVTCIATRFGQAFAISSSGDVYAWGMTSGDHQQPHLQCSMGFGRIAAVVHPMQIPSLGPANGRAIRSVAVGVSHTIFLTNLGDVYTVGRNDHSKLGLGVDMSHVDQVLVPQRVRFPGESAAPAIVAAAAGATHSLFLAGSGEVWGCGSVKSGALPTSRTATAQSMEAAVPCRLDLVHGFCTGLAAGISCSFFISDRGQVYFSGQVRQSSEAFDRPPSLDQKIPWRIQNLRGVAQVSVSMEMSSSKWEHVLFSHDDGSFSGWGYEEGGGFLSSCCAEWCPTKSNIQQ